MTVKLRIVLLQRLKEMFTDLSISSRNNLQVINALSVNVRPSVKSYAPAQEITIKPINGAIV